MPELKLVSTCYVGFAEVQRVKGRTRSGGARWGPENIQHQFEAESDDAALLVWARLPVDGKKIAKVYHQEVWQLTLSDDEIATNSFFPTDPSRQVLRRPINP